MIVRVEQTETPLPEISAIFVETKYLRDVSKIANHVFGNVSYRATYPLSNFDKQLVMAHGVWNAYSFEQHHLEHISEVT